MLVTSAAAVVDVVAAVSVGFVRCSAHSNFTADAKSCAFNLIINKSNYISYLLTELIFRSHLGTPLQA